MASVAEGLGEKKLVVATPWRVGQCGAQGYDGLIRMARVERYLTSGGPTLSEFLAVGDERAEEKQCDEEQDNCYEQQTQEGE